MAVGAVTKADMKFTVVVSAGEEESVSFWINIADPVVKFVFYLFLLNLRGTISVHMVQQILYPLERLKLIQIEER
jgi:hypothetical protein